MIRRQLLIALVFCCLPVTVMSAGLPWYAGVSAGASSLRPETQNSAFTLDSSLSAGAGVFVGYDFSRRISFELGYHHLGSATLSSVNINSDLSYAALSAGALMYVYGDADDIADRNGLSGYVRLGLSAMQNETSIPLEKEDNVAIWAGVGMEWPFSTNLSLRGELTSFDGDAQAARVLVLFRPHSLERSRQVRNPRPTPSVQSSAPRAPEPQTNEAPTIVKPEAQVEQSLAAPRRLCVTPAPNEPTDTQGCGLFSGPLRGVEFASGTAILSSVGEQLLDRLSEKLLRNPTVAIEIQAHTESFGNATRAKEVARQRTLTVARYLASKGVPVSRLRARAFGHSQPVAADDTVGGRRKNNRIELRVLR